MGNILTLSRTDTNSNTINSLTYKYLNSGSKLAQGLMQARGCKEARIPMMAMVTW